MTGVMIVTLMMEEVFLVSDFVYFEVRRTVQAHLASVVGAKRFNHLYRAQLFVLVVRALHYGW